MRYYISKDKKRFISFLCLILFIGLILFIVSPTWYKTQIRIIPNQISGKKLQNNFSLISSILNRKTINSDLDLFRYIPDFIKTNDFIYGLIGRLSLECGYDPQVEVLFAKILQDHSDYFKSYYKSKNNILMIQIAIPDDPILCRNIATSAIIQLNKLIQTRYKDYQRKESQFIEKAILEMNKQMEKTKGEYLNYYLRNKNTNNAEIQNTLIKLKNELSLYEQLLTDLKLKHDITSLEKWNDQSTVCILEDNIDPIIKYKPYAASIFSYTILGILLLSIVSVLIENNYIIKSEKI